MPEIRALRAVTTPVVVQRGDLSVTLFARMEKVNARDTEYSKLVASDVGLQIKLAEAQQVMQQRVLDVAAPVEPSPANFEQFRAALDGAFVAAREALALPDLDARESGLNEALGQAVALTSKMDKATEPNAKAIEKREKELTKQAEASRAEIEKMGGELRSTRARRLIYLLTPSEGESPPVDAAPVVPWDLTDGGEPWPLTEENIGSVTVDLAEAMLEAVEKKVTGFSVIAMGDSMSS